MPRPETIALELLEYKVADLQADRQVRGGTASIWELYHHLSKLAMQLTDQERQRFYDASHLLRKLDELPAVKKERQQADLDSLVIEDVRQNAASDRGKAISAFAAPPMVDLDPELLEEQAVLQRLARQVWWSEIEDLIQELAGRCRAEKNRATARLLYALSRNLELTVKDTASSKDLNLLHFQVKEPVPERLDPLVSLNNLDNLTDLVREIIEIIIAIADRQGLYQRLEAPKGQALAYVKKMALAIARDPYAGELSAAPHKGPSSAQLRLALQELAKEPMREDERQAQLRALEQRLRQALLRERQLRESFQQDVQTFLQAAEAFFDRLERYLPLRVGGEAGEPQLKGGVLFGLNPALRVTSVAPDAQSVTVRLKGPTRFVLNGLEMAVTTSGSGRARALAIGEQSYPLQPRQHLSLEGHSVLTFFLGDYLHVRVTETGRPLATLVAEALAVYAVLSSGYTAELLRLLRMAGTVVVGEPQDIVMQALERLRVVSSRAPNRRVAIEGMLRGAAKASGVVLPDNLLLSLVQRFHAAMTIDASALPTVLASAAEAEAGVYQLGDDPLSLSIGGQPVTIRRYRRRGQDASDSVVVMLPGRVLGSFVNTMVAPFPGGVLVCARARNELVTLFFHEVSIDTDSGTLTSQA